MSSRWTKRRMLNAENKAILSSCLQVGTASEAAVHSTDSSSSDSVTWSNKDITSDVSHQNQPSLETADLPNTFLPQLNEELGISDASPCSGEPGLPPKKKSIHIFRPKTWIFIHFSKS